MGTYDNTVDADELMQDERPMPAAIPVQVEGTVRVQQLPSRAAGITTVNVDANGKRVLTADPRRSLVRLYAFDQEIRVSDSQAGVTSSLAGRVAKGAWVVMANSEELWIASATSVSDVTVIQEAWAH